MSLHTNELPENVRGIITLLQSAYHIAEHAKRTKEVKRLKGSLNKQLGQLTNWHHREIVRDTRREHGLSVPARKVF